MRTTGASRGPGVRADLPGGAAACDDVCMKQFIWYLLFGITVFVSYQGYVNSKDDPETEAMSRDVVCALDKECGLTATSLANVRTTDITSRNYQWNAKAGSYVATCKREYVFVGHWKCEARPGQIARGS